MAPGEAAELLFEAELFEVANVVVEAEPNGLAMVAPVVEAALVVDADADAAPAGGNPRGFATVAPCTGGVAFELAGVAADEAAFPSGLATVAVDDGATVDGGCDTVAESACDVTLAAPAELVVEPVLGATATGTATLAVVAGIVPAADVLFVADAAGVVDVAAAFEVAATFEVVVLATVGFAAEATLTVIEEGCPELGGKFEVGVVFTVTADAFGDVRDAADVF